MNYILQLSGFFQRVSTDDRLNPTHVSLYMAIFQFWNTEHFQNPVSISRQELMRISKISAKATYHKCIKDLHNFGYIKYIPSFNPFKGSLVYLFDLQSATVSNNEPSRTKIETSIEQALVPYLNNINSLNKNIEREENTSSKNDVVVKVSKRKAKVIEVNDKQIPGEKIKNKGAEIPNRLNSENTKRVERFPNRSESEEINKDKRSLLLSGSNRFNDIPPKLEDVLVYFVDQKSTEIEANKFYNYFQSNGWKIGGKAPMKDWQAAAQNWILNIPAFSQQPRKTTSKQPTPGNLNTATTKNYSEPL